MNTSLVLHTNNSEVMIPVDCSRAQRSVLTLYCEYLDKTKNVWYRPQLDFWRDSLLKRLSPSSAKVYLSTVRARYKRLLKSNAIRDALYQAASERLNEAGQEDNPANRRAFVQEVIDQISNAIHPSNSEVPTIRVQDKEDNPNERLNPAQVAQLRKAVTGDDLKSLRDRAIICTFLATGIREGELCNIQVSDLRQRYGGELALRVQCGKGRKKRLVVYGKNQWYLSIVQEWLDKAEIKEGYVFRPVSRWGKIGENPLTTRGIRAIFSEYPLGDRTIKPHQLRKTYALEWYKAGGDILALSQQLGHSDIRTTTEVYIGLVSAERRRAPTMYAI